MADISVRLGGDSSEFRGMLDKSVQDADAFAGKLSHKVADKLLGLRDVSHAVATALGLNLEHIAENVARVFTGMTKSEEEGFKNLEQLSAKATDLAIKNMRAVLTEEQKYQLALQEREKLQRVVDAGASEGGKDQARLMEARIKLEEKQAEILDYQDKKKEERKKADAEAQKLWEQYHDARMEASDKEFQAQLSALTTEDKVFVLKKDIAAIEKVIASGALDQKNTDEFRVSLAEKKNRLTVEAGKLHDEKLKQEEKSTHVAEYQGELLGSLIKKEKERLDLLAKQTGEFTAQLDKIAEMAGAGREGFSMDGNGVVGPGMITVAELEKQRDNAKRVLDAAVSKGVSTAQQGEDIRRAQTMFQQLDSAVGLARQMSSGGVMGAGAGGAIPISALNLGGLGLGGGGTTDSQALKSIQKNTAITAAAIKAYSKNFNSTFNTEGFSGDPAPPLNAGGLGASDISIITMPTDSD